MTSQNFIPIDLEPGLWSRMFSAGVGVGNRSWFSKLLESGVSFLKLLESESVF